jgi:hypothetical protein
MKEQILQIWQSRTFGIGMDVCRILLLIVAILILYRLITEIEIVKLLNSDPCRLCENKTGAICYIDTSLPYINGVIPSINYSELNFTTNK